MTIDQVLKSSVVSQLLDDIAGSLQLTKTQFEEAQARYKAASDWLGRKESSLSPHSPYIYPQGSVAIGTTVKPRRQEEHDIDLVLLLQTKEPNPMALYEMVRERLAEHAVYKEMLDLKNRCLRLDYSGEFHLDILPAKSDPTGPETRILVPDRELKDWHPSDPKGFAAWFLEQASRAPAFGMRATEPLPDDNGYKSPLQRTVQLLKRRRDIYFEDNPDDAPRSIVLTTLAGLYYSNESRTIDALHAILAGMASATEANNAVLRVENPVQPKENFAEAWDARTYSLFVEFVMRLVREVDAILEIQDIERLSTQLAEMFGENPTQHAFTRYAEKLHGERKARSLFATASGLTTANTPGPRSRVQPHKFWGDVP